MRHGGILVWDASALHHAAAADRVDVLAQLASAYNNLTTSVVLDELGRYGLRDAATAGGWLGVHELKDIAALTALAAWSQRLGAGIHHAGEATVATACQQLGAIALLDDHPATTVIRAHGIESHGTVWLAAQAVNTGREASRALDGFFTELLRHGARFPFPSGPEWGTWAADAQLIHPRPTLSPD